MSARTQPVTPAERACAAVLRAWLDWPGMADDNSLAEDVMSDLTRLLHVRGLRVGGQLTPAGRALLARVEAEDDADYQRGRRDERAAVNRELRTGDVDAANVKIDDLESLVAELRGKLAGSAPPAKEPR